MSISETKAFVEAPFAVSARCVRTNIFRRGLTSMWVAVRIVAAPATSPSSSGGHVAEQLRLELRLSAGVRLLTVIPIVDLTDGPANVVHADLGDLCAGETRVIGLELFVDGSHLATANLGELSIEGRGVDGSAHRVSTSIEIAFGDDPHARHREAERDVLLVRADLERASARHAAGVMAREVAVAGLRARAREIEHSVGFVGNDGSALAEMHAQLMIEASRYEQPASAAEVDADARPAVVIATRSTTESAATVAALIGISPAIAGPRIELQAKSMIGRSADNEIRIFAHTVSRRHARIQLIDGAWVLGDLGTANGCSVNGKQLGRDDVPIHDGDLVTVGCIEFRFEAKPPQT
ncbi:MAG: FHA domain-containing protein [Myxococcales bacterium]|nr:FHA domain-containing protein [Myxococcales bacterium]